MTILASFVRGREGVRFDHQNRAFEEIELVLGMMPDALIP